MSDLTNSNNSNPGRIVSTFDTCILPDEDADGESGSETETEPEYYKQTARKGAHGLTAIEGRVQDLVWFCRTCGSTRATLEAFEGVGCDG